MANIATEQIGAQHLKLTVKLEKQDYQPAFEKKIKEYAKKANIPGFRKGFVPNGLILKMYGKSVFTEEVINLANQELHDYLIENKLLYLGRPMFIPDTNLNFDYTKQVDYDFNFELGLIPELDLQTVIKKANITRYNIEIAEDKIVEEIDFQRNKHGKEINQDTADTDKHILVINYNLCDSEGILIEECDEPRAVELGELPKNIAEKLKGCEKGKTIFFRPCDVCSETELVNFLSNELNTSVENSETYYSLKVEDINLLIPSEMNKDFFMDVFNNLTIETEEDFRSAIVEELGRQYKEMSEERLDNDIFEYFVHNTNIELPVAFLKRYLKEGEDELKTDQEVEENFPKFEHQLRWQLISNQFCRDYSISVTKEESINEILKISLRRYGIKEMQDVPEMDAIKASIAKNEKLMTETKQKLLTSKVFNKLITEMTIEDKTVKENEFYELMIQNHHHH